MNKQLVIRSNHSIFLETQFTKLTLEEKLLAPAISLPSLSADLATDSIPQKNKMYMRNELKL